MAERRMFTKKIVDSDAFLDMPLSTQALYFHLNMRADDDGFVNNPKKIQRMIGASEDDLKLLIAKRFILCFENGVIVIKHWRMHNLLRKDRYNPTQYQKQMNLLMIKDNGSYTENQEFIDASKPEKIAGNHMATNRQPTGNHMATQVSIGKYSIGKESIGKEILMSEPEQVQFIQLPLNTGDLYPIYENEVSEWKNIYPNVDVEQQLRNMLGWLNANPTRRKTKSGIKRFINGWLSKEQDKSGKHNNSSNGYDNERKRAF